MENVRNVFGSLFIWAGAKIMSPKGRKVLSLMLLSELASRIEKEKEDANTTGTS